MNELPDSPPAFEAQLAVFTDTPIRGAASGYGLDPDDYAADLLTTHEWSGLWLLAYMTARFGPYNAGSDPEKQLCSWMLTTPMEGLALLVTPYMGQDGSKELTEKALDKDNIFRGGHAMHFAFRCAGDIINQALLPVFPALQAHWDARDTFMADWWQATGHQRFAFIACAPEEKQTLIWSYGPHQKHPNHIWGLYVRTPEMEASLRDENDQPISATEAAQILSKPLGPCLGARLAESLAIALKRPQDVVEGVSPLSRESLGMDVTRWPVLNRQQLEREEAAHDAKHLEPMRQALRTTLADLLRPVWVRDIAFNALGRCYEGPNAQMLPETISSAPRFAGAGWAAKKWYEQQAMDEMENRQPE